MSSLATTCLAYGIFRVGSAALQTFQYPQEISASRSRPPGSFSERGRRYLWATSSSKRIRRWTATVSSGSTSGDFAFAAL